MKKVLSLALALALCLGLTVPAYAAGDFTIENGVLTEYNGSGGKVVIPDGVTAIKINAFLNARGDVTEVIIPNSVTTIMAGAFFNCDSLKSITIPASVTEIEESAFFGASGLTTIEVDPANTHYTAVDGVLFSRDKTLLVQYPRNKAGSSYTVPAGVTRIGVQAFRWCENLTSVTIPNSVNSIGEWAFFQCFNLTDIDIPASVTDFGAEAFVETPWYNQLGELPVVNNWLLQGPKDKSSVVIPDGVTTICDSAFEDSHALKSVTIPNSVTKIGNSAFGRCDNLTDINIPDSVTDIGEYAFWACDSLTSLTIPSGLTSISPYTFYGCDGLTSMTIPGNVKEIGEWAFDGCSNLAALTLSPGIEIIGEHAFSDCKKLTSVSLPGSVTEVGDEAFSYCNSLTSVTIPASVTKIGKYAFHTLNDNYNSVPIPGLTIHGAAGSYAETYAKANSIPFVADVSAAPAPAPAVPASPTKFTDVAATSPFVDAINWAVEKNITTGLTTTTFGPGEKCTNGQILTFLWRASGSPEPTVDNPFTDPIPASFQKAAVWAYEKGLVSGAVFGASTPCTRAVTVEYLWKAAGSPATSENASFADVPANADYAQAVAWAVENGVTSGTGNGQFSPANTCTRGQIVTFLYRAMGK